MRTLKRAIVAGELISGAFILATVCGAIAQNLIRDSVIIGDTHDAFIKMLIALLFIGSALFYDGLRRGRQWW